MSFIVLAVKVKGRGGDWEGRSGVLKKEAVGLDRRFSVNNEECVFETLNICMHARTLCLSHFLTNLPVRTHPFEARVDKVLSWLDFPQQCGPVDPEKDGGKW